MKYLQAKTALITGAQKGIGYAIAEKLASLGADIFLTDINPEGIKKAAETLSAKYQVKAEGFAHDVSKELDCENAVSSAVQIFGKIDILVNNAGITRDNLVLRMKEKDFDDVIAVNLKGPFFMCKSAFKHMSRQRSGRIVNISSVVGQCGQAGQANYSSSKAGLIGLTKSLAREFSKRNVNVNAVAPGFIETDMTAALEEKTRQAIISQIPLERLGKPEDVANAVAFLCSEESSYITGQIIAVNGGIYI
ncbi:MAG: 3-oxoacyl-[acyl-carrier-protein] reductase [Elusimicrobiota bacterium]